jgi:hypothetical protein
MNNTEILASHKRMYSWIKERAENNKHLDEDYKRNDWEILTDTYPELLTFLEDLIFNVEKLVNREQELLEEIKKLKTPSNREELRRDCERFVITDSEEKK